MPEFALRSLRRDTSVCGDKREAAVPSSFNDGIAAGIGVGQ